MEKTSDKGYFIISPDHQNVSVEKAHFCTWRLPNGSEFLEVGLLILLEESFLKSFRERRRVRDLEFKVFIPWYEGGYSFGDLFPSLKNPENAKFVFNDQVVGTKLLSGGSSTTRGVRFSFQKEQSFCLLPVVLDPAYDISNTVSAKVSFPSDETEFEKVGNLVYIRFFVKSGLRTIPWKHGGVAKTTFSYDIKVNEPRNAPSAFPLDQIVRIHACYCLHIVPSSFECSLQDRVAFKSIRTLESSESAAYTNDIPKIATKIRPGDCLVVFNKARHDEDPTLPFSFFTVFSMERIGPSQLALAIGTNIGCGLLAYWTWIASIVFLALVILFVVGMSIWQKYGARIRSALGLA